MEITVNGELQKLPVVMSVSALMDHLGYPVSQVAVAVNGDFVPRSHYHKHTLQSGDALDVVAAVQGG